MALKQYPVVWTDESIEAKNRIFHYLQKNWSKKEIKAFFALLDQHIQLLSIFPEMGKISETKPAFRKSILTSYLSIYYKFENDVISIATIFDTRQDPEQLNL